MHVLIFGFALFQFALACYFFLHDLKKMSIKGHHLFFMIISIVVDPILAFHLNSHLAGLWLFISSITAVVSIGVYKSQFKFASNVVENMYALFLVMLRTLVCVLLGCSSALYFALLFLLPIAQALIISAFVSYKRQKSGSPLTLPMYPLIFAGIF